MKWFCSKRTHECITQKRKNATLINIKTLLFVQICQRGSARAKSSTCFRSVYYSGWKLWFCVLFRASQCLFMLFLLHICPWSRFRSLFVSSSTSYLCFECCLLQWFCICVKNTTKYYFSRRNSRVATTQYAIICIVAENDRKRMNKKGKKKRRHDIEMLHASSTI